MGPCLLAAALYYKARVHKLRGDEGLDIKYLRLCRLRVWSLSLILWRALLSFKM